MTEFSDCNLISLKSYTSFPDFLAEHQWKPANWVPIGIEHDFSTATHQILWYNASGICCVVFFFIKSQSLHPYLTAEQDGWQGTGEIGIIHMMALPLHHIWAVWELFLIKRLQYSANWFNAQKLTDVLHSLTPNLCLMDTVIAGCVEHAHQLICVDITRST